MSQKPRGAFLRLATRNDLPVIDRWLAQADMRRWWGSPVDTQCEMRIAIGCHNDLGRIYLILGHRSEPVGLVSLIHGTAFAGSRISWSEHLPLASWEIGILIGSKENRRRGLGTRALIEVRERFTAPFAAPVFAWIEKDNVASLAVFARLGYRRVHKAQISHYGSALLKYDRDGMNRHAG